MISNFGDQRSKIKINLKRSINWSRSCKRSRSIKRSRSFRSKIVIFLQLCSWPNNCSGQDRVLSSSTWCSNKSPSSLLTGTFLPRCWVVQVSHGGSFPHRGSLFSVRRNISFLRQTEWGPEWCAWHSCRGTLATSLEDGVTALVCLLF